MRDESEHNLRRLAGSHRQIWAAILALQTSQVHAIASGDHFSEWWGYGVFFAVVALCQFFGGIALLLSSRRSVQWFGLIGTLIVLLVWFVSRTAGVHLGPDGVGREPIGLLDSLCTALEVLLVYCLTLLLRAPVVAPLARLQREARG